MKYISISGAVAAGKTTLLEKLLAYYGERAIAHEERPQDNPFINEYYSDSRRWSFHSQITFLALYFDHINWLDAGKEFYFFDRCLIENLVLARYRLDVGDLTETEYGVIAKMAKGISALMPPIDKYIYLKCSVELLTQRLRRRGREYESELGRAYAERQKILYDAWAETLPKERVLVIDQDAETDIETIIRFIES